MTPFSDFPAMRDLLGTITKLESAPKPPSGILTHHSVPWGRVYHQWDTKGRLWLWINRGWIEDWKTEPGRLVKRGTTAAWVDGKRLGEVGSFICRPDIFGIPVYNMNER